MIADYIILYGLLDNVNVLVGRFHQQVHTRHALHGIGTILHFLQVALVALVLLLVFPDFGTGGLVASVQLVATDKAILVEHADDKQEDERGPEVFVAAQVACHDVQFLSHKAKGLFLPAKLRIF